MPAPAFLSRLPKPVLFGLYGAVGGLLGALLFGELIMLALGPKASAAPPLPPPEPRLAVGASDKLQIYQGGTNKLLVQIARDGFDDDVTVRVEGLPPGVTPAARELVIPATKTAGDVELRATFATAVGTEHKLKVLATAKPGGKTVSAEPIESRLTPLASPMPLADIVFVLDITGSMQHQIDGLKNGIGTFANDLQRAKVDARFGCLTFRDLDEGEPSEALMFGGLQFTADANAFSREVARLRAGGGGESLPESSLEAIVDATKYDFRKGAARTLILITDAAPKIRREGATLKSTADALTDKQIDLLHLVIHNERPDCGRAEYREVQRGAIGIPGDKVTDRGKEFSLSQTARDSATFTNVLLPEMTRAIVAAAEAKPAPRPELAKQEVVQPKLNTVKAVQSDQTYDASATGQLVLAVGVWTGAIAALVCLFLVGGQHHYLRGTLPSVGGTLAGLGGGLVVGLIGGAAGQGLFLLAPDNATLAMIFRVLGWTILGALAGAGLSLFVPNLKLVLGLAGGAVGGTAGAIGYIVVESVAGAVPGRLAGGLALGLCIGLMVAVVEAAFRHAWLEVRFSEREVITVNLGAEPVKVGGDAKACTVWARGAADVALRYFIRDGKVICTDVPAREEFAVADGDTRAAGKVTVVVRTGSGTAPVAPARPAPPPVPKAKPAPAPKPLDIDEDDAQPLPISPRPASPPPAPVPTRPPVPVPGVRPPAPVAPKQTAPPAAPAPKPATRDPDACPSCGRKTPGRPGSRYCMVCDQTY